MRYKVPSRQQRSANDCLKTTVKIWPRVEEEGSPGQPQMLARPQRLWLGGSGSWSGHGALSFQVMPMCSPAREPRIKGTCSLTEVVYNVTHFCDFNG